jgi:hypothetical protein
MSGWAAALFTNWTGPLTSSDTIWHHMESVNNPPVPQPSKRQGMIPKWLKLQVTQERLHSGADTANYIYACHTRAARAAGGVHTLRRGPAHA